MLKRPPAKLAAPFWSSVMLEALSPLPNTKRFVLTVSVVIVPPSMDVVLLAPPPLYTAPPEEIVVVLPLPSVKDALPWLIVVFAPVEDVVLIVPFLRLTSSMVNGLAESLLLMLSPLNTALAIVPPFGAVIAPPAIVTPPITELSAPLITPSASIP